MRRALLNKSPPRAKRPENSLAPAQGRPADSEGASIPPGFRPEPTGSSESTISSRAENSAVVGTARRETLFRVLRLSANSAAYWGIQPKYTGRKRLGSMEQAARAQCASSSSSGMQSSPTRIRTHSARSRKSMNSGGASRNSARRPQGSASAARTASRQPIECPAITTFSYRARKSDSAESTWSSHCAIEAFAKSCALPPCPASRRLEQAQSSGSSGSSGKK